MKQRNDRLAVTVTLPAVMRSRNNANMYHHAGPSSCGNADVVTVASQQPEDEYNGRGKVLRKRLRLPPPPQMTSLLPSTNTSSVAKSEQLTCSSNTDIEAALDAQRTSPIPVQQQLHHQQKPTHVNQTSGSYPYHNKQPSFAQISQPYKPNNWYINSRILQRKRQRIRVMLVSASSAFALVLFYFGLKQIQFHEQQRTNHHYQRHHHDHHHHIHMMTGFMESQFGFAKESYPQIDHSQPILSKQTSSIGNQQPKNLAKDSQVDISQIDSHRVTSFVPVTTLSNGRLLPLIGFGVASQSVDHKEIPSIVATLLQYASSESEGGGGIAMIDAVIDEKREVESNGGSFLYSGNLHKVEENEEILENSKAKTAISLVGRAISFFGKENMSMHGDKGLLRNSARSKQLSDESKYDYENRLEVHLLIGLSDADLGRERTINALRDIFSELDELVPPFPNDLDTDDVQLEPNLSAISKIDRRVDLRIHVLLRSPHCHDKSDLIYPCTKYKDLFSEKINKWTESYDVVEKLYDKHLIQGIGFDGVYVEDVREFLQNCRVKPQIYRGDVYQALEGYGRRMGVGYYVSAGDELQRVLKDHNITFLASNVAGHVLENKPFRPHAYGLLQTLGSVLFHAHREYNAHNGIDNIISTNHKGGEYYTVPRLILAYLVKHKVGVLPHASKAEHLADDAPESVSILASFLSKRRLAEIGVALKAMMSDRDLPEDHGLGMEGEREAAAVFHNEIGQDALLFRVLDHEGVSEEVAIPPDRGGTVGHGHSSVIIANPGDKFAVYGADGRKIGDYFMNAEAGGATDLIIK